MKKSDSSMNRSTVFILIHINVLVKNSEWNCILIIDTFDFEEKKLGGEVRPSPRPFEFQWILSLEKWKQLIGRMYFITLKKT